MRQCVQGYVVFHLREWNNAQSDLCSLEAAGPDPAHVQTGPPPAAPTPDRRVSVATGLVHSAAPTPVCDTMGLSRKPVSLFYVGCSPTLFLSWLTGVSAFVCQPLDMKF